jgi:hypothetical protein
MRESESMLRALVLVVLLCPLAPGARAAPHSVAATYDILLNGLQVAVVNERFEMKDGHYRVTSNTSPMGLFALAHKLAVRLVSEGAVNGRGLQPRRFEGRRGRSDTVEASADFDWTAGRLDLMHEGKSQTVALPAGTQDRLSVMYQFMFLAPNDGRLTIDVTNGRDLERYTYQVTPGIRRETALGPMSTVHLVKQRDPGESQNEIWLAPEHGYMPVGMVIVERDGTRYEQRITRLDLQS